MRVKLEDILDIMAYNMQITGLQWMTSAASYDQHMNVLFP